VQLEADRKWWPIGEPRQPRVKGIIYVVNGVVRRIRRVDPEGKWRKDDRGYVDVPVSGPLDDVQIAREFPTLPFRVGDERPRIRKYVIL
jgi:hypothetical protein